MKGYDIMTAGRSVFFRYAVVGCLGTAVDLGSLYLFVDVFHVPLLVSTAASFILAVINNFILNKYWTFRNRNTNVRKQFIKFLIVSSGGLLLTEVLMAFFVYVLGIWYMAGKLITSGLVLVWNFLANKYWTFRDRLYYVPSRGTYSYDVSVVVPAYNEQQRIGRTLRAIDEYFRGKTMTRQIIVVDDGSADNTVGVVEDMRREMPDLSIVGYQPNCGKGWAIRKGIEASKGEFILFTDADNSTPIEEFDKLYPLLRDNEVVIGSRYVPGSHIGIRQPWHRVLIGRFGNRLIQALLLDGIRDTQCGFKAFQHEAAKQISSRMKVRRFGFDIEMLSIARLLNFSIRETPVNWYDSQDSRLRPIKDALRTFGELIYIKLNLWGGRYT